MKVKALLGGRGIIKVGVVMYMGVGGWGEVSKSP